MRPLHWLILFVAFVLSVTVLGLFFGYSSSEVWEILWFFVVGF